MKHIQMGTRRMKHIQSENIQSENDHSENGHSDQPAFEMHTEIFECNPLDLLFFEIIDKIPDPETLATKFFNLHRDMVIDGKCTEEELADRHLHYERPVRHVVTEDAFYHTLVKTIFYSGFRPSVIDRYMPTILNYFSDFRAVVQFKFKDLENIRNDPNMIRNKSKIKACYENAWVLHELVHHYGSIQNYFDEFRDFFEIHNSFALLELYDELQQDFYFLGEMTTLNFMTDLGFDVFKPTREVMRAFKRLGLICHEWDYLEAVYVGRRMSAATRLPLDYIVQVMQQFGR